VKSPGFTALGARQSPPPLPFLLNTFLVSGLFSGGKVSAEWRGRAVEAAQLFPGEGAQALVAGLGSARLLAGIIRHPLLLVPAKLRCF